ncbi:TPA: acetylxylan esterase [bacterium]|nr:acetylxylan esterase [bacterium]
MRYLRPVESFLALYDEERVYEFKAQTVEEWKVWRESLKEKLIELLGGFTDRIPLEPEVLERKEFKDYTRERVIFNSAPKVSVVGYLLIPKETRLPAPGVIALHGHGYGKDDIVGIWEDGTERSIPDGYQKDFGISLVKSGLVTFAIEQSCFGERREPEDIERDKYQSSCRKVSFWAMLLGKTVLGMRVWDIMRAIDYLETREEVNRNSIGVMGISGGGMTALFSSALDERIKAAVVSGYLNTFKDSILSIHHCECNYVPGILKYAEMYDIAGLIAPRSLLVESGTKDNIFPIKATEFAISKVRRVYELLGVPERFDTDIFEGRHQISGRKAFEFLRRELVGEP